MLGERWALLVVRELRLGPRRYGDLQAGLPGLGPSVLAQRLRDLERAGVVERRPLPSPGSGHAYALTRHGADLEPVFAELARWAMRSPLPLAGEVTDDSAMLGLRTFFDRGDAPRWTATYVVRLARERYVLRVVRGELTELARKEPDEPVDATIETTGQVLVELMTGRLTLPEATNAGRLTIAGSVAAARKLIAATGHAAPVPRRT